MVELWPETLVVARLLFARPSPPPSHHAPHAHACSLLEPSTGRKMETAPSLFNPCGIWLWLLALAILEYLAPLSQTLGIRRNTSRRRKGRHPPTCQKTTKKTPASVQNITDRKRGFHPRPDRADRLTTRVSTGFALAGQRKKPRELLRASQQRTRGGGLRDKT